MLSGSGKMIQCKFTDYNIFMCINSTRYNRCKHSAKRESLMMTAALSEHNACMFCKKLTSVLYTVYIEL